MEDTEQLLLVVNIDDLASEWQIPVDTIVRFIVDQDMPMEEEPLANWFAENTDMILQEKQKAFDELLFPRHLWPEPAEATA